MIEHLLRKRGNSNRWLNLTSNAKEKKKITRGNINKWLNLTSKAKKKMIKIVVLDIQIGRAHV